MDPENNILAIFEKIGSDDLYPSLVGQLNKDFQLSNIDVQFEVTNSPEKLVSKLNELVLDLVKYHYDDYLNLLYRVDVEEKELRQLNVEILESTVNQVVFLILKRESQKVWLRKNYNR